MYIVMNKYRKKKKTIQTLREKVRIIKDGVRFEILYQIYGQRKLC